MGVLEGEGLDADGAGAGAGIQAETVEGFGGVEGEGDVVPLAVVGDFEVEMGAAGEFGFGVGSEVEFSGAGGVALDAKGETVGAGGGDDVFEALERETRIIAGAGEDEVLGFDLECGAGAGADF